MNKGTELQPFDVNGSDWRFGQDEDGRPYVVADDFTPHLGYSRSRDALRMVDEDEKGAQIVRTPGGDQRVNVLYEDGIWELIFLSRKPEAKALKKRVKEILREIRQTGSYSVAPQRELSRKELALLVVQAEEEKERLELENAELRPKAEVYDMTMDTEGLTGMTALGAMVGTSAKAVTAWMVERGWFSKQPSEGGGNQHLPLVDWNRSGHFTVRQETSGWRTYPVAYATNLGVDMFVREWQREHPAEVWP